MRRWVPALVGAQLLAIGGWWAIDRARAPEIPFPFERIDEAVPPLPRTVDPPAVVHFWATWCVPCAEELPALVAAARAEGVPLVALTEEPEAVVGRFFGGEVPREVVADAVGTPRAWQVSGLPDTYAVVDDRVRFRIGGPRDWSSPEARRWLRALRTDQPTRQPTRSER